MIANRFNPLGKWIGKPLPYAYRVEYIETTGDNPVCFNTQLPTNLFNADITNFEFKLAITQSRLQIALGGSPNLKQLVVSGSSIRTDWFEGASFRLGGRVSTNGEPFTVTQVDGQFNVPNLSGEVTYSSTQESPVYLFARYNQSSTYLTGRIYSLVLWNRTSGNKIANIYPVMSLEGELCFYDDVRDLFMPKLWSGSIVAGKRI